MSTFGDDLIQSLHEALAHAKEMAPPSSTLPWHLVRFGSMRTSHRRRWRH